MDQLCLRCTRRLTYPTKSFHSVLWPASSRTFVTSSPRHDDDVPKINTAGDNLPFKITRSYVDRPTSNGLSSNSPPRGGQLLRRSGPPPGPLLRRTGSPPQYERTLQRTRPPMRGARPGGPGGPGKGKGAQGKQRRRRTADSVKAREAGEVPVSEEELEEYVKKFADPPANPTERIEYEPNPQEMTELQKDWPNTPLSNAGLSASLVQKIEWLARRIPHGYQTPEQLAERFQKGNLTRFESEKEKQQVLKIAKELAQKRADALSERKGSEVAAEDMDFSGLSVNDENYNKIIGAIVGGKYDPLQRQRMPFLDSIARNLRNNGTYHKADTDKFMATIEKLMPAQAAQRRASSSPPQQEQKKA